MNTTEQPILTATRLRLRPFQLADAGAVQRLAGDRAVADTATADASWTHHHRKTDPPYYRCGAATFFLQTPSTLV
jgi:hypothetical protein